MLFAYSSPFWAKWGASATAADRPLPSKPMDPLHEQMTSWRRDFHRHPELAFEEKATSGKVAALLESFGGIEVHRGLAGTGVVGVLRSGSSGRSIALRADMDALPIHEENEFEHRSRNPGKMHACGHDGHTAMLLGAAKHLSENRSFDGTVYFFFQPAEEKDGGARVMIEEGLFEQFPADEVYGVHNYPGMSVGNFGLCAGPLMAAIDIFEFAVTSPGGHAAFPHGTVDPIPVSAEIVLALQTVVARNVDPLHSAVITVARVHGGQADNVIPSRVVHGGCIRAFLPEVQKLVERRMRQIGRGIASAHGAGFELEHRPYYPATVNHAEQTDKAANAAREVGRAVTTDMAPVMGSEDFSFMLQERPGAFMFLGNGDSAGLHTPRYDFNDDVLPVGMRYWTTLVETQLSA